MKIDIREYTESDHTELVRCVDGLQKHVIDIDPLHRETASAGYAEKYTDILLKAIGTKEGKSYLAQIDNKIVGFIAGTIQAEAYGGTLEMIPAKSAWVRELYVDQDKREKGVGTMLMDTLEKYFKSKGCTVVFLNIFAPNVDTHTFYESRGYVDRGITMLKKLT